MNGTSNFNKCLTDKHQKFTALFQTKIGRKEIDHVFIEKCQKNTIYMRARSEILGLVISSIIH